MKKVVVLLSVLLLVACNDPKEGQNIKIGSVALRNSKPVFQLGLSISQPKSKRLPQDPNRILPCVSVFYEPYVMFQCLQLIFVRFYRF